MQFIQFTKTFLKNEDGAAAIEYALIAAIIGVGLVAVLGTTSADINSVFTRISTALKAA